jgi:hypothetical protein
MLRAMRDLWQQRAALLNVGIAVLVVVGVAAALLRGDLSDAVEVLLLGVVAALVARSRRDPPARAADVRRLARHVRRLDGDLQRSATRNRRVLGRRLDARSVRLVEKVSAMLADQRAVMARLDERLAAAAASVSSLETVVGSVDASVSRQTTGLSELSGLPDRVSAQVSAQMSEVSTAVSAATDRQRELLAPLQSDLARLGGDSSKSLRLRLGSDVGALLALYGDDGRELLPAPSGWALSPHVLALVLRLVRTRPDLETVVELGSGVSTSWVARELRRRGSGRLVSFEHDPGYAATTATQLAAAGVQSVVDLRCAPLAEVELEGEEYRWYQGYDDVPEVGLLLVDGPPAATGVQARYPAGPLLLGRMAMDGLVVLDDVHRPDEGVIVERWLRLEVAGRTLTRLETVDRAVVFRVDPAPG